MTTKSPRPRRSVGRAEKGRADDVSVERAAPIRAEEAHASARPVPFWQKLLRFDESELPEDEEQRRKAMRIAVLGGGAFTALVGVYAAVEFGPPAVVLMLTGLTLIAVIAALWTSVRTLLGETKLSAADAFAIGAPRAEEEQKRAVLRALKDLEFERTVGKISEEDYAVLVTRYRTEAKRLLREIDQATAEQRARAEEVVQEKLVSVGLPPIVAEPVKAPVPAFEPIPEPVEAAPAAAAEPEEEKKETAGDA